MTCMFLVATTSLSACDWPYFQVPGTATKPAVAAAPASVYKAPAATPAAPSPAKSVTTTQSAKTPAPAAASNDPDCDTPGQPACDAPEPTKKIKWGGDGGGGGGGWG